jgi:misacylated tRNA(Ala) deacylase
MDVDSEIGGIVLDKTAFYPGGGGQPADTGSITFDSAISEVIKFIRVEGNIWHILSGVLPKVGQIISGKIDWGRRLQLMRTHTAMHILCGVIWRDYKAHVTGGNMEPLGGRMDFKFEHMSRELVEEIEEKINLEVKKARGIEVNILIREEANKIPDLIRTKVNLLPPNLTQIRTVNIKGLDLQADGGTHVNNTSEVGYIRITEYKSKGKINKRLKIQLKEDN